MRKLNSTQVAMAFSGSFVGAGLVSRQELYQFFGLFGWYGIFGSVLTTVALVGFGSMAMTMAKEKNQEQFDYIITAFVLSLLGFKNLVATIFPICGYIGLVMLWGIAKNYINYKAQKKG